MHIFYAHDINTNIYSLNEDESKHCSTVLRLSVDDLVYLTDGKGCLYKTKIIDNSKKKCIVKIIDIITEYEKRDYYLHIAISPTKNIERFEWFLEKVTEIGIDEITPILSNRSERKVIKIQRLNKVIISAMKQSKKAYHPILNPLTKFEYFVKSRIKGKKFIAHCMKTKKESLKKLYTSKQNALILIGPEGDFSPEEIALAKQNNFLEISLGTSFLRTETAGIIACHTINFLNGY